MSFVTRPGNVSREVERCVTGEQAIGGLTRRRKRCFYPTLILRPGADLKKQLLRKRRPRNNAFKNF